MHRSVIQPDGSLHLGDQALTRYAPGTLVDVVLSSTGTLYVTPADESQTIDLPPLLPLRPATQRTLQHGRRGLPADRLGQEIARALGDSHGG